MTITFCKVGTPNTKIMKISISKCTQNKVDAIVDNHDEGILITEFKKFLGRFLIKYFFI